MAEAAGIVMSFAGATAPEGWLLCDGSAVSRSTYSALFDVIGTTYGAGDGSTTFNVPDLSGKVIIGVSGTHALGTSGGEETHTLLTAELPAHTHEVPQHGHANTITATTPTLTHSVTQPAFNYSRAGTNNSKYSLNATGSQGGYNTNSNAAASRATNAAVADHAPAACTTGGSITDCAAFDTSSVGSDGGHNNMQPFAVLNYIISVG